MGYDIHSFPGDVPWIFKNPAFSSMYIREMMRTYIATWGDPRQWKYAEYCYDNFCQRGFSTLSLVTSSDKLKPNKILIFLLDTLAGEEISEKTGKNGSEKLCYIQLVSRISEFIRKYLCTDSDVTLVVLPGVMGRGGKVEFRGDLNDTRLLALYYLYFHTIKEALSNEGDSIEILLDTTHGVNYFINLISGVVREAAVLLSVATLRPVTLRILNADPLPYPLPRDLDIRRSTQDPCTPERQDPKDVPKLSYNLLREEKYQPWDLVKYMKYDRNEIAKTVSDECACDWTYSNCVVKETLDTAKRLVATYRVGALLELAELVFSNKDWANNVVQLIKDSVKCWQTSAELKEENGVVRTVFRVKLMDGFRLLLHAHALYTGVIRVLKECDKDLEHISLECVEKLSRSLLKGSEVTNTLVSHEIGGLTMILDQISTEWTLYASLSKIIRAMKAKETAVGDVCKEVERVEKQELERYKRNFIAHVGLLMHVIEVKKHENTILLRTRDYCKKVVYDILDNIFNDLASE